MVNALFCLSSIGSLTAMPLYGDVSWPTLLAEASEAEIEPLVLAGVLLSLITVYLAAKIGGELCARLNLPPVLGELLGGVVVGVSARSEEHTSELQSRPHISYAVFCLKKKK